MRTGSVKRKIRKAYDSYLQLEVTAQEAKKFGGFEHNRYICVFCGEEVYVAAAESTERTVHFRHRRGNNNVDCEFYLGNSNNYNNTLLKRRAFKGGEIYFDQQNKTFCLGLRFSEDELEVFEQKNIVVELRTKDDENIITIPIRRENFAPETDTFFPLSKFSPIYYLTYSHDPKKNKRINFNLRSTPTFFKILGDDSGRICRYVRSGVLYTNTKYLAIFPSKFSNLKNCFLSSEIDIENTFEYRTMNQELVGIVFTIKTKSASLVSLFKLWKYKIEYNETFSIIWPPTYQIDNKFFVNSDYLFVYSTFQLNSKENINVSNEQIQHINSKITKIYLSPRTIIHKKNTELIVYKTQFIRFYHQKNQSHFVEANFFKVPEDGLLYFLYCPSGAEPLKAGQSLYLTPNTMIIGYRQTYPEVFIYPKPQNTKCGNELLEDILAHIKKTESFTNSKIELKNLSETAFQYLRKCQFEGKINSVARQYIEEGRL